MMQAGRDYCSKGKYDARRWRPIQLKSADLKFIEQRNFAVNELAFMEAPPVFRSVNQDKPVLRLK